MLTTVRHAMPFANSFNFQMADFVVLYHEVDSPGSTTILCTSYNIERVDKSTFGCRSNFTVDVCDKNVVVTLEAWTVTGRLLQPTSKPLFVDCDAEPEGDVVAEDDSTSSSITRDDIESNDVAPDTSDTTDEPVTTKADGEVTKTSKTMK